MHAHLQWQVVCFVSYEREQSRLDNQRERSPSHFVPTEGVFRTDTSAISEDPYQKGRRYRLSEVSRDDAMPDTFSRD